MYKNNGNVDVINPDHDTSDINRTNDIDTQNNNTVNNTKINL